MVLCNKPKRIRRGKGFVGGREEIWKETEEKKFEPKESLGCRQEEIKKEQEVKERDHDLRRSARSRTNEPRNRSSK